MSNDDSGFGDFEPDDAFDGGHLPADPLQVARHLHEERRWIGSGEERWEDLSEDARAVGVALIVALLDWLHGEGTEA